MQFASEIAASPYNGDPWAWIQARIQDGNYSGIGVGDWIPFELGGNTYHAEAAGIDTYTGFGGNSISPRVNYIGHHIDFISREVYPTQYKMNKAAFNNGIDSENASWGDESPFKWMADLWYYLNSQKGFTISSKTLTDEGFPTEVYVDYSEDGIYYNLPSALKAVVAGRWSGVEYRAMTANTFKTTSDDSEYQSVGKLWLPTEIEVYGFPVYCTPVHAAQLQVQYPLFRDCGKRRKVRAGTEYGYAGWWLCNPTDGSDKTWSIVNENGFSKVSSASASGVFFPICFRIAETF